MKSWRWGLIVVGLALVFGVGYYFLTQPETNSVRDVIDPIANKGQSDMKIITPEELNLRISDRIWSDDITAGEYLGSVILHSQQGIQDTSLVLAGLIGEYDVLDQEEYTLNLTVVEDSEAVQILSFDDVYASEPVYITKQKLMSTSESILVRGGAFLLPYIVTEGIELERVNDDLYIHVLDWWNNEIILYNPLDQNITRYGDNYDMSIWSNDVRYITFLPANMLQAWTLQYEDQKIASRQLNFLSPYLEADERYDHLEYTAPSQLLYPGSELDLSFAYKGEEPPKSAILSSVDGLSDEQSLALEQDGGSLHLSWNVPTVEGKYLLEVQDEHGYIYLFPFSVESHFGLEYAQDSENLLLTFASNFPLDQEVFTEELDRLLGEGNYKLREYDEKIYEVEYHLEPFSTVSGSVTLSHLYGDSASVPVQIFMKEIPDTFTNVQVKGSTINMLPGRGYRGNKVAISHFNKPTFTLYYEPCELNTPQITQYANSLEETMFDCRGSKLNEKYVFTEVSEYRQTHHREIEIPFALSKEKYYRVSAQPDMQGAQYFMKSDLGIMTKLDANQLLVWVVGVQEGKPIQEGVVAIYDATTNDLLSSYPLQGTDVVQIPLEDLPAELLRVEAITAEDKSFVVVQSNGGGWWYYTDPARDIYESYTVNSYVSAYDLYNETPRYRRGGEDTTKIYGYTDRALYKAGDEVHFAGFVRDVAAMGDGGFIPQGQVRVTLTDINGEEVGMTTVNQLDDFGGFAGSFKLRDGAPLGHYYMLYEFNGEQFYSHDLRVEEFQKPTFFVRDEIQVDEGVYIMTLTPEYYFGSTLPAYDIKIEYSLEGQGSCWYCRRRNEEEYYYNHLFNNTLATGASVLIKGRTGGSLSWKLFDSNQIPNFGGSANLKVDVKVVDLSSDEVQFATLYRDIDPPVRIGLQGQPSDWLYGSETENYTLRTRIDVGRSLIDDIVYEWYYQPFDIDYEYGVDGNRYYIQGRQYELLSTGLVSKLSGVVPHTLDEGGRYFLRVYAVDSEGNILGEVQKQLSVYLRDNEWGWQGTISNNYKLSVQVPQKEYTLGDEIEIDIDPYVSGARVLLTVEKGNRILYHETRVLGDDPITLPVRQDWYPSVNIGVVQIVGEQLSPGDKRKEPRFFIGYAQAQLSSDMVQLDIDIATDKESYQPGETVQLTITTSDAWGGSVDARVSLAVVDKALIDLYAVLKEPIPYFYNKLGSFVSTYTNLKFLYQMLHVFSADGSKGGGGGDGGFETLAHIREDFADIAYWDAEVITSNGKANVTFQLPDNLTTWTVDAIGITKELKLGTHTKDLLVEQPFMIEANLPSFVTIGDNIDIPLKIVANKEATEAIGKGDVQLVASLTYSGSQEQILPVVQAKINDKAILPIKIPHEAFLANEIDLKILAAAGGYQDAVVQKIPLRSQGFLVHDYLYSTQSKGKKIFSPSQPHRLATLKFGAGVLPVQAFDKAFTYLLNFPYGCTEQLMSSLYPIATALRMQENGILDDKYLDDNGEIKLHYNAWSDSSAGTTTDAIYDGLNQIFEHQQDDGGFAYWEHGDSVYKLSAYVYGGLALYRSLGYDIPSPVMDQLIAYLRQGQGIDYQYYLRQASQYGSVAEGDILSAIVSGDVTSEILGGGALANIGSDVSSSIFERIDLSALPTEKAEYGVYIDALILQSMYVRGLLANQNIDLAQPVILQMLEERDSQGKWGWSTQRNVQALQGLSEYLVAAGGKTQSINCKLMVGEETQNLSSDQGVIEYTTTFAKDEDITLDWNCDSKLFVDAEVSYLYQNLSKIATTSSNVETFTWSTEKRTPQVGDKVQFVGTFEPIVTANQLAIEYYIPSNYKFLETISKKGGASAQDEMYDYYLYHSEPFTTRGDADCRPDHREVRFDRLFLYYDELSAGASCEVSIDTIYAYNGNVLVMPSRLWEMYSDQVHAITQLK